jgi:DNA polymerase-3 subunit gamma/tau
VNENPEDFFAEEPDAYEQDGPGLFEQDGPGLFDTPDDPVDDTPSLSASAAPVQPTPATADTSGVAESDDAALPEPAPAVTVTRPEAPLALYRRYRPETFAEVIGQEHVTEPLQRALQNNKVNHAYLFSGPRGCGKTTSARILARALNCEQGPTPVPCGECASCIGLARGGPGTVDVIEFDAASHGGVNETRDLRERVFFSPVSSRYKIYIIDEAHMVTKEGFNALLKVVEEPPPHVKFIFATTEPEKVLGTIRSRTHHYPFRLVPPKVLGEYLHEVCDSEGVRIDHAVLPLVVRAGGGSVRDSLSILDQLLGGAGENGVTYTHATALLGFTPDSLLDEAVDAIGAGDAAGVFAAVEKVSEAGQDPRHFAEDLLRRLRDLLIVAAVPEALTNGLIDVAPDQAERLKTQAAGLGPGELTRAAEVIATGLTEMRGTTAPRLHLELMLARVLLPGADVDGRGLHARLDRLERRLEMIPQGGAGVDVPASRPQWPDDAPEPAEPRRNQGRSSQPAAGRSADTGPASPADRTPEGMPSGPPADGASTAPVQPVPPEEEHQSPPRSTTDTPEERPSGPRPDWSERRAAASGRPPARDEGRDATVVPIESRREQPAPQQRPAGASTISVGELRARWPEVLSEVKRRRRFTWILLSQNAQVAEVTDGVLTLDIANVGARESFGRGGSDQVLRDALVEVLGVDLRVAVSGANGTPASGAGTPPAPPKSTPTPAPADPAPVRTEAAEQARQALRSAPTPDAPATTESDVFDRDDPDLDEGAQSRDELLATELGATLIGEEEPE